MGKFVFFIIFFVIGLIGGAYLKDNSTTPNKFVFDATGKVIQEIESENVNVIFSPLSSLGVNPLVLSAMIIVLLFFIIMLITKTFSTLFTAVIGISGGVTIFFAPIIGIVITGFGVVYSLILEEFM